jgi:hypothetical protein
VTPDLSTVVNSIYKLVIIFQSDDRFSMELTVSVCSWEEHLRLCGQYIHQDQTQIGGGDQLLISTSILFLQSAGENSCLQCHQVKEAAGEGTVHEGGGDGEVVKS